MDIRQDLERGMSSLGIPNRMQNGIRGYVYEGREPGGFLRAVFANDLCDAASRADGENGQMLYNYAYFLINYVPLGAWGSWEAVKHWPGLDNQ